MAHVAAIGIATAMEALVPPQGVAVFHNTRPSTLRRNVRGGPSWRCQAPGSQDLPAPRQGFGHDGGATRRSTASPLGKMLTPPRRWSNSRRGCQQGAQLHPESPQTQAGRHRPSGAIPDVRRVPARRWQLLVEMPSSKPEPRFTASLDSRQEELIYSSRPTRRSRAFGRDLLSLPLGRPGSRRE